MKRIIRLSESDLTKLVKMVLFEIEGEERSKTSISEWDNTWIKLRRKHKSFSLPENDGFYSFGGLFFFYDKDDGCIKLPPQNPYDWRNDYSDGVDIIKKYYDRLDDIFNDNDDMGLSIEMGRNLSITICKS